MPKHIKVLFKKIYNTFLFNLFFFRKKNTLAIKYWKNIKDNSNHSYEKYIIIDKYAKKILKNVIKYSSKKDKILDICCNVGRHLNFLNNIGYVNLCGFDINSRAVNQSIKTFPRLKNINIYCSSAETFFKKFPEKYFDVVYTHGATLELIPPTFNLVKEISRVVKNYAIIMINEDGHAFPRFWRYEFSFNNLKIIKIEKYDSLTLFILKKKN